MKKVSVVCLLFVYQNLYDVKSAKQNFEDVQLECGSYIWFTYRLFPFQYQIQFQEGGRYNDVPTRYHTRLSSFFF